MQEAQAILSQVVAFKDKLPQMAWLTSFTANPALQTELCQMWSLKYKNLLHQLRESIRQNFPEIHAGNIDEVQLRLTQGYEKLLKAMLEEAFRLMGDPPCVFAWVGAGSFSRSEILPHSDVEYLWLFEAESLEVRCYFWAVDRLIVAQLHSLDEPLGLHPDQYMEVTHDEAMSVELPDSLYNMFHRFHTKCKTPEGVYTEILSNLQGRLIAGDPTLWEEYLRQVKICNPLPEIFHKLLLVSVADYDKTWSEGGKSQEYRLDIKKGYGYFLTYLAVMLKFYHGVEGNSTQEIWQALIETQKINPALGKALATAAQEIQALRCRMHFFYQESRQDIDSSKSENGKIYVLSEKEQQTLSDIQKFIQTVYRHLGAVKKIEALTKLKKNQTEESAKESVKTLAVLLEDYQSLEMVLMKPKLSQEIVASYFYRLLTLPQYLGTLSGETCLEFLLKSGMSVDKLNTLGIKPMEVILSWSEGYPDIAQKTWQVLLNFGGNSEEILSNGKDNLLSCAMHLQKHETFIVLCQLGAGRTNSPAVLFQYIDTQLSSPQTPSLQKQHLQNVLPRLMQQNPSLGWQLALSTLRLDQNVSFVQLEGTYTPLGFLNPQMEKELFKQKGKVQAVNIYGRREVAKCTLNPVINVYAKFYPELPGIEESVRSLSCILSHHQTVPHSELFCFKSKTDAYPVLISQEVVGENLQTVLNQAYREQKAEALQKLKVLDTAQWTALFLLTVLIHPEDGKPDNYILKPFQNDLGKTVYAIVGIDNDHAFVDTFTDHPDEDKAFQIKTILYCLDQMQVPLDSIVIQAFLAKDPEKSLSAWLDSLSVCQRRYAQLFSEAARALLFKKESVPQMIFPPNSLPQLYERWGRLKKALPEKPNITAMQTLLYADPPVGLRYQAVFDAHTQPLERFHAIASPAYLFAPKVGHYKTLVTSSQLLKSQHIAPKLLLRSQQYGPEEAKKSLYEALYYYQYKSMDTVARKLSQGDMDSFTDIVLMATREAVLKKTNFSLVEPQQQAKFISLILNKNTGLFGLENLVLSNLSQLTLKEFIKLLQASPALASLRLAGLPQITRLDFLASLPIKDHLKTLVLQQLPHLTEITLPLPALRRLVLIELPTCQKLHFSASQQLRQLKIQDCPLSHFKENLEGLIRQNSYLTLWQCELDKNMRELASLFIEKAKTDSELWNSLVHLNTLPLKKLRLNFPHISRENALVCLSALLYNTVITRVEIHTQKREVCMTLIMALRDDNAELRKSAAEALLKLGQETPEAIAVLMTALGDKEYWVRQSAAEALGNLKQANPEVITALVTASGDYNAEVRQSAAEALRKLKQAAPELTTTMTTALKDKDNSIRQSTVGMLRKLKQLTSESIPVLLTALEDKDNAIRQSAIETLGKLKQASPQVVRALITALGDKDKSIRQAVVEALVKLGQEAPEVILALVIAGEDKAPWVKQSALETLVRLGYETPEIIKALLIALEDYNAAIRQSAVEVLGNLKQAAPEVITALLTALGDYNAAVKKSAAAALVKRGQETPHIITALIKAWGDYNSEVRKSTAEALGKLKQAAPEVITALITALGDKTSWAGRGFAAEVLGELFKACSPLSQTDLQAVRSLSDKFDLWMEETAYTLVFHAPVDFQGLQALFTEMLIPVEVEGLQLKIPHGITIAGLTELLWSLQPTKVRCEVVLTEAYLTALSRFQPRIEKLILKNKNMNWLKLALIHTRGVLTKVDDGEQLFNLVPLRRIQAHLKITSKNAKTLHLTLYDMSSVKAAQKLLDDLYAFIKMTDNTVDCHFSEQMLEIHAAQETCIKDIFELLEALQTWAGLHADKLIKLKSSLSSKEVKKRHALQKTKPKKILVEKASSVSSDSSYPELTRILPPSPLPLTCLITPVNYTDLFKRYRDLIWAYVEGKATDSLQTVVENLAHAAVQPIEKIILLEAIEWQKEKLGQYEEQLQQCGKTLILAQSFQRQEKNPQWDVIPDLLKTYQAYLKNHLHDSSVQPVYDSCLVLFIALQAKSTQDKKWDEKAFFRQLTEQQVYRTCQIPLSQSNLTAFHTTSIKSLWKILLEDIKQRLPISEWENQQQTLNTQISFSRKRYQSFIVYLQQYLALPTHRWKQRYFHQTPANLLQRCGGKKGNLIQSFFRLNHAWDNNRMVYFDQVQWSSLLGSTYFSSDKPLAAEETLCLDANYQQDHTGATADGYGHFGSLAENRKVQLAAYRTAKYITRYASLYPNPESLIADLPVLFQHVGKAVQWSFLYPEEAGSASCVLTRLFQTESGSVLVCAGMGDSMVAVFDPIRKIAKTLIAPRQYDRGGQFTPLSLTEKLAEGQLQIVCCELSDKAILFRMTDGAWEALPHQKIKYYDPQAQRDYLAYTLEEDFVFQYCATLDPDEATANEYRQLFERYIQKNTETRRHKLIEQQQRLQTAISAFEEVHLDINAVMGDFMTWAANQWPDFSDLLYDFLRSLRKDTTDIQTFPLTHLHIQLAHVNLGHDITLHIESVSEEAQAVTSKKQNSLDYGNI